MEPRSFAVNKMAFQVKSGDADFLLTTSSCWFNLRGSVRQAALIAPNLSELQLFLSKSIYNIL